MKQLLKDVELAYGEKAGKTCRDVITVVRAKVIAADYFGWRSFIDDMLIDLVMYMIKDEFKHSGGGYVACGIQSALDHCRYCNAQKRRGDYELLSLDEFFQVADETPEDDNLERANKLVFDISIRWGQELADSVEPYLKGYEKQLSKQVLAKLKSEEFVEWFKDYMKEDR